MPNPATLPAYCLHRASGQAVVRLDGRDIYLGKHDSKESRAEYDRLVGEWLAAGRRLAVDPASITIAELLAAYLRHANSYYRNPDGTPSRELERIKLSMSPLSRLYSRTPVAAFTPLMLKAIRLKMVDDGRLARKTINDRINSMRRIFRWGVSEGIVKPDVLHGLQAVDGLRLGRSEARESKPVMAVPEQTVLATILHTSPQVAAMVRLQLLTGMRPGEVCRMRTCDIDTTGNLWTYTPATHKTAWHGHKRVVYLGPKAQDILKPLLKLDTRAFIFTPAESDAWRREQRHLKRTTPNGYGNNVGTNQKRRPKKKPGECYDAWSYRRAIDYACRLAFPLPASLARRKGESIAEWKARLTGQETAEVSGWRREHSWHPHQLRHTAATELRKTYGIEAAQVILGHKTLAVTEIYAEKNVEAAQKIMAAVG